MFQIEKSSGHAYAHYVSLSQILNKRVVSEIRREEKNPQKDPGLLGVLKWFLEEKDNIPNIQRVITEEPEELEQLYHHMIETYLAVGGQWAADGCITEDKQNPITAHQVEVLQRIFNYTVFSKNKQASYDFVANTGVHICPYCNQEFVFSIGNRKNYIARSDLDHYLPKSRYPMFALSYYNLIPSGKNCNSNIKGAREMDIRKHFHPYIADEEKSKLTFYMEYDSLPCKSRIRLDAADSEKAKETIDFFRLNDIYQIHTDESNQILELFETYPPDQLEYIIKVMQDNGIPMHMNYLLHMLYAHYDVKDPENEILGNLRHDLYKQVRKVYLER